MDKIRNGRFTSSQMHRLADSLKNGNPGAKFNTYVEEKFAERLMGRPSDVKASGRPLLWGCLMECVLFDLLGMN